MIRSEQELQVALDWIAYWRETRTVGQSWLGNEQASRQISALRVQIDEYRREACARVPDAEEQISQHPV